MPGKHSRASGDARTQSKSRHVGGLLAFASVAAVAVGIAVPAAASTAPHGPSSRHHDAWSQADAAARLSVQHGAAARVSSHATGSISATDSTRSTDSEHSTDSTRYSERSSYANGSTGSTDSTGSNGATGSTGATGSAGATESGSQNNSDRSWPAKPQSGESRDHAPVPAESGDVNAHWSHRSTTPSSSTRLVQVETGSFTVPAGKVAGSVRFAITEARTAPASIQVTLSTGEVRTVALSTEAGETAYYQLTLTAGTHVTGATAAVPCHWTGEFRLVGYEFANSGTGSTSGTGTSAGGSSTSTGSTSTSTSTGSTSTGSTSTSSGSTSTSSSETGATGSHSTGTGAAVSVSGRSTSGATVSSTQRTGQVASARAIGGHAAGSTQTGSTSGGQANSGGGFPVGETGKVAPAGNPEWPLIGIGLAGLLAAALLFARSAHGTSQR